MTNLVPAQNKPQRIKKPRLSKRLVKAIDLWLSRTEPSQKAAALKAGLSEAYFSRALRKPSTRVFLRERATENVSNAALRASERVGELIDGDSSHVAAKVSLRLLEAERFIPPAGGPGVSINLGQQNAGYIISLGRQRSGTDPQPLTLEEEQTIESGTPGLVRLIDITPDPEPEDDA